MESSIRLRLIDQTSGDKSWESTSRLRIGRLKSLEIALDESSVSRNHAEIYISPRGWRVRDLRSTNGTSVNGSRLGAADWPVGLHDIIKCGDVTFVVEVLEIAESTPGEFDGRRPRRRSYGKAKLGGGSRGHRLRSKPLSTPWRTAPGPASGGPACGPQREPG